MAKSTVFRVTGEYFKTGNIACPKRSPGRKSLIATFDENVKYAVRSIIHGFFYNNELPTLDKIVQEVKKRPDLPQMSRSTLYKLMKQINFK